jgi:hypothetical protein
MRINDLSMGKSLVRSMARDLWQPYATVTDACGQIVCHAATRARPGIPCCPVGPSCIIPRCGPNIGVVAGSGTLKMAAWHHLAGVPMYPLKSDTAPAGFEVAAADPPGGCDRAHVGAVG